MRVEMKNQNGVQVYLASASKGVDVSLRGDEPEEIGFQRRTDFLNG